MEHDLKQTLDRLKSIERHAINTEVYVRFDAEEVSNAIQNNENEIEANVRNSLNEELTKIKKELDNIVGLNDRCPDLLNIEKIIDSVIETMFNDCEDIVYKYIDCDFVIDEIECRDNVTIIKI